MSCLEDCVLYTWTFRDLDQLMRKNPSVGMIFEGCISSEMNRKFSTEDPTKSLRNYEEMLHAAMMDGELKESDKERLTEYRTSHGIGDEEHMRIVKDLGWTLADFEAGSKGGPKLDVLEEYYGMMDHELKRGTVTNQSRTLLRHFRMYNKISR